ncbi:protein dispatched homolog 1-like isoform X2 [Ptychodera flava]|uniref:protein dispatched homolog 1-like isoform X2 n=1 Tax=Ptychodera flava TaxID=63121 RepID=UPI003969C777
MNEPWTRLRREKSGGVAVGFRRGRTASKLAYSRPIRGECSCQYAVKEDEVYVPFLPGRISARRPHQQRQRSHWGKMSSTLSPHNHNETQAGGMELSSISRPGSAFHAETEMNGFGNPWVPRDDIVKNTRIVESRGHVEHGEEAEDKPTKRVAVKKPLALCKLIVKYPNTAFAITLCFNLSFMVVTLLLVLLGQSVFPTVFADLPLQLRDDDLWLRYVAWEGRDQNFTKYSHKVDSLDSGGERTERAQPILLIYEKPGGNVFTKEYLTVIQNLEDGLVSQTGYEDYCQLDDSGRCMKPTSIIRFFDGTYASIDSVFNDTGFENIPGVLHAADNSPILKEALHYHLGKDFELDVNNNLATTSITRSFISLGLPLAGNHTESEMDKMLATFLTDAYFSRLEELSKGYGGLDIMYYNAQLWRDALDSQVIYDIILVGGSISFIFGFMWFQTRSLWVTSFGVLGIITSFCGTNLIYRYALDFRFFGTFHILSIFIILGIGADDVFVFMDTWRATSFEAYPSLEHRLSDAYRRSSVTMLVTSLTTAMAFFVNAFSPLLGVKTFGIFAGILVLVNYFTVITFLPNVVIMHHNHWSDCVWCCCKPCAKSRSNSASKEDLDQPTQKKKNIVVRFFMGPYYRFVTHKIFRWVIIFVFIAMVSVFLHFASKLGPQEEPIQVFKDGNNFVKYSEKNARSFLPSSSGNDLYRTSDVYIVWGLQNQNVERCHHTDYECMGNTVWDDGFDLNPSPSQEALKSFCQRLRNLTQEEIDRLHILRDLVTGEVEVDCFIDSMYDYYQNVDLDGGMPITEVKMRSMMDANPNIFNTSELHDTFYRYFETGVGYWLTRGYNGTANSDNDEYGEILGEEIDERDTLSTVDNNDVYGTRLRYAAFKVTTTLTYGTIGYDDGVPIINAWEEFVIKEMEKMPPSVSNGFQCTCDGFNLWHWIKVQKTLADSAVQGVILGIALAFPLLVIATMNIVLGGMATLSIGLTTGCVIGVIPLAGWKLGLLESLNLSLIVGLAVDYVVHLAEGYHLSPKEDRLGRLHDMLEHVGVSVVSGATTTLGASMFMLFAQIKFFMQFGIFMFSTIGFSLLFSLGLFTTMLGIMGPQGRTGSLVVIYHWLIGRNKVDVDCDRCEGKGFHSPKHARMCSKAVGPSHGAYENEGETTLDTETRYPSYLPPADYS